jgi:hypothetical protein
LQRLVRKLGHQGVRLRVAMKQGRAVTASNAGCRRPGTTALSWLPP